MKILVFSDSHGKKEIMKSLIRTHGPQLVLHLGDYAADYMELKEDFPEMDIRGVKGNCDIRSYLKEALYITIEDKTIFMTHGHNYNVKRGYDRVIYAAMEKQADILLFGHTHRAYRHIVEGIHILNPGSIGRGTDRTFGIIEITDGEIKTSVINNENTKAM